MLVVTLGDALLDVVVRLAEPLEPGGDANATTWTGAGGQAANVAAWAVALGAQARVVTRRGDDATGVLVAAELAQRGVDVAGPVGGRTGVVVSLVESDGERTLASDRGTAPELRADDLDASWFACDCLHISGYALFAEPMNGAARRAAELARGHGASISIDLSASTRIRAESRFRASLDVLAPDLVFGNEVEWEELGAYGAARIVKRGAAGFDVVRGEEVERCQADAASVVDTTGAGDALAAGFLVGGPELAATAAARCIARLGAMP